ncbi:MAG TPA: hypothetical protein VGY51_13505 [Acidimicrobiales bacterium]|jgi:hypothetical protein|nr:hypothetical protein [Acidimicrobiales bacterium]
MLKKTLASIVIGGVLLGGAASGATAYAGTPAAATATAPASTGNQQLRTWIRDHRRQIRKAVVAISAKTIGVTPAALVTELRSGKSIATVAGEHGVSAQTVVNALTSAADAKITQAVAAHKLTSAQASKIEAALPARLAKLVNHTF